jgi:uncharacterized membrane protein YkvA (DUF1232 family)
MSQADASTHERVGALRQLYNRALVSWYLFWDRRVGFLPKLIPLAALVYLLSPVDLIPEGAALLTGPLAPVVAPLLALDDVALLLWSFALFQQAAPPDIVQEHLRRLSARMAARAGEPGDDVIDGEVVERGSGG